MREIIELLDEEVEAAVLSVQLSPHFTSLTGSWNCGKMTYNKTNFAVDYKS